MKLLTKLIISLVVLVLWIWGLDHLHQVSSKFNQLPSIGSFLSPSEGFLRAAESKSPKWTNALINAHVSAPVEVVLDERNIPHIFAQNLTDAALVQGYLVARDRLWQMDISVRATSGELSEIFGPNLINKDKSQRRKGILWAAQRALQSWENDPEAMSIINAYSEGVNLYISQLQPKDYPIEFKLLKYAPRPWTALNSAIFYKSMAEKLNARSQDVERTNTLATFGPDIVADLFPDYNDKQAPVVPNTGQWSDAAREPYEYYLDSMMSTFPFREIHPDKNNGSNNWAVSGALTKSGNPILCNDPHLTLTLPSIWYEQQIHTPLFNAYGVSLPGVPGIIIGFNEDIAWGVTNVSQDVKDWYSIKWANKEKTEYLVDGKTYPIEERQEVIRIKGQPSHVENVKYTIWGPIVHESDDSPLKDLAMRWVSHDTSAHCELRTFLQLMSSENLAQYKEAAAYFTHPGQNFAFAARSGDIGIRVQGNFPIRNSGTANIVVDGSTLANQWKGYVPQDQIAQMYNPERHFIASANQRSTSLDYPYYYYGYFDNYRGRILVNKLSNFKEKSITIDDMKALQLDTESLLPRDALPRMIALLDTTVIKGRALLHELEKWDYHYNYDEPEGAIFNIWMEAIMTRTWDEFYAVEDTLDIEIPELWRTIELLSTNPTHPFFDDRTTTELETAKDIITLAYGDMLDSCAEQFSKGTLKWGTLNNPRVMHLANIKAFSHPNVKADGFSNALNAMRGQHGPSWRMVVELGDSITAFGNFPGGPSGNPGSFFYDNQLDKWANGEYYPLRLLASPTADSNAHIITFTNGL